MKTKFLSIALVLVFTSFIARVQAEEQTRKLDSFKEISLRIDATIQLQQGSVQNVKIEAKPSTLGEILTEVKDNKLIIRYPNKNYLWKTFQPGDITIYITIPEIDELNISGSGNIVAEEAIIAEEIELSISGSGNIQLADLSAKEVEAIISGSGDIELAGKNPSRDLSVTISGSGDFKGLDFKANDVSIKISGSGNVGVEATENLYVRTAGSGDVTYRGQPLIDQSVAGSGSVKNVK
jgi:hypothetical protein